MVADDDDEGPKMSQASDDELEIVREPLEEPGEGTTALPAVGGRRRGAPRAALDGRPRRRGLEALAVLGVLVLAVVIVLSSIHRTAPQASVAPSATPAPEPVMLASDVNFGTFTLNGKRLKGSPPLLVTLRNGRNTITLTAPPFKPATCTLVWPGQQGTGNDCSTGSGGSFMVGSQLVTPALMVFVNLDATDLPEDLALTAQGAIATALGGMSLHTTVPSGDYFAVRQDASGLPLARRATAPMLASLAFLPPDGQGPGQCPPYGLCGAPLDNGQGTPPHSVWSVFADVRLQWTFTAPGTVPLVAAPVDMGMPVQLWLAYDGAGGWQVVLPSTNFGPALTLADQLDQDLCFAGANLLQSPVTPTGQQFGTGIGGTGGTGDHGVDGCLIQLLPIGGSSSTAPLGNVIWRFGALLAADAGAHKLLPTLPLALPDELRAVGG